MDAVKLLKKRRSIREFTDQEVEKKKLEKMVEIARFAPTANNVQPWELVVITDDDKLQKIKDLDDDRNYPAAVAVFTERDFKYKERDGSNISTYLTLAAKTQDLGSCWINISEEEASEEIREMLDVPEDYELFSIISVGHSDENPLPDKRKLEDVIHWENY